MVAKSIPKPDRHRFPWHCDFLMKLFAYCLALGNFIKLLLKIALFIERSLESLLRLKLQEEGRKNGFANDLSIYR